jgi:uncharacterized Zn-binding protein involved in type VI secretion
MPPQARLSDIHTCTLSVPPASPIAMILPMINVMVNNMPAARLGDLCAPGVSVVLVPVPPHPIIKGSATVFINYRPAARIGDTFACGGPIALGSVNVITGG